MRSYNGSGRAYSTKREKKPIEAVVDSLARLRSTRSFKPKEIPEEVMKTILEVGRHAPTTRNIQPWHFILVSDPETKKRLARGTAKFIEKSAVVIVGCGDPEKSPRWHEVEVSIAMQSMVIAAWIQGVGSCWVDMEHREEEVKETLGIPEHLQVSALVAFGYPDESSKLAWKKPLDQIIHYDKF